MIPVLVADDNAVIRSGLKSLLEAGGCARVVGEAGNGQEALRLARELEPEVVLLDVRMPVMGGLEAAGPLSQHAKVLMLTYAEDDAIVTEAVRAGASGYLVHGQFGPEELADAVARVARGDSVVSPSVAPALFDAVRTGGAPAPALAEGNPRAQLTEREAEIMDLIARGRGNADIAAELFLGQKTVKNHINRIFAKLEATNRAEAIAAWLGTRRP